MNWEIARMIYPDEQDDEQIMEIIKNMYVNQLHAMKKNGTQPLEIAIVIKFKNGQKTDIGLKAEVIKKEDS